MKELQFEICSLCGEHTGCAGSADDSIYCELLNPYRSLKTGDKDAVLIPDDQLFNESIKSSETRKNDLKEISRIK